MERARSQTEKTDPWAEFTTAELETKRVELRRLIDSGILTERSLDNQLTEIAMIENELAKRR